MVEDRKEISCRDFIALRIFQHAPFLTLFEENPGRKKGVVRDVDLPVVMDDLKAFSEILYGDDVFVEDAGSMLRIGGILVGGSRWDTSWRMLELSFDSVISVGNEVYSVMHGANDCPKMVSD